MGNTYSISHPNKASNIVLNNKENLKGPQMQQLFCKDGNSLTFRQLEAADNSMLGQFFQGLSAETKSKYGPHPLTQEYADELCQNLTPLNTTRMVAVIEQAIVGYFIIDFREIDHEVKRYATFGITLTSPKDPFFAPCISDQYQNLGIASLVMPHIIDYVKQRGGKSLVLLGGTQETNTLGIRFYKKWGFQQCGSYFSHINNLDMRLVL